VCVVLLEDFSVCWHNFHASLSSSKLHTGCRSIFVLLWCNFLTLKLVFHNHWTPWLFLVNLTHLPVPPLKFPNPAPVLWLFYVTIHNSSFKLSTIPPSRLSPWYVFWILCEIDRTNCICKIWINKPYHKPYQCIIRLRLRHVTLSVSQYHVYWEIKIILI
jgi:hypothetical protein